MNTLPDTGTTPGSIPTPPQAIGGIGKEKEIGLSSGSEPTLNDLAKEMDLPKEVVSAGVSTRPTVVSIPPLVQNMGVKPAGQNIPTITTGGISMVLTDDQIAKGLHASIASSIRWLAEWCRRKLKVLGIVQ